MRDIENKDMPPAWAVPVGLVDNAFEALTRVTRNMDQEELDYRGPGGDANSTATLIAHLTYTDLDYLQRIKGEEISPALEAEFGPNKDPDGRLAVIPGRPLGELQARYRKVIGMIHEYAAAQTDEDALKPVAVPWWSEPATARFVLWHTAAHSMLHQGHITRLRGWYRDRGGQGLQGSH